MPAALSMPAASIPRRGAGSRSVASSTMTPAHSPMGRSLSAGCSGWPTHRPPCSSSRTRLSWCRSRTGPNTAVSQSLRVRSQPSRSSQAARSLCQTTNRVVENGELIAGSACWPTAGGSSAWPLPLRIRFLHGGVSLWLDPEENLLPIRSFCASHLGAHAQWVGIAFANWPTALTSTRMAVNGTAIGDDHMTRSRRPNWTICAPSGALPGTAAQRPTSGGRGGCAALAATRAPGHEPHDDEDGHRDQPDDEKRPERCHDPARGREGKPYGEDRAEDCPDDPAHVPQYAPGGLWQATVMRTGP